METRLWFQNEPGYMNGLCDLIVICRCFLSSRICMSSHLSFFICLCTQCSLLYEADDFFKDHMCDTHSYSMKLSKLLSFFCPGTFSPWILILHAIFGTQIQPVLLFNRKCFSFYPLLNSLPKENLVGEATSKPGGSFELFLTSQGLRILYVEQTG